MNGWGQDRSIQDQRPVFSDIRLRWRRMIVRKFEARESLLLSISVLGIWVLAFVILQTDVLQI